MVEIARLLRLLNMNHDRVSDGLALGVHCFQQEGVPTNLILQWPGKNTHALGITDQEVMNGYFQVIVIEHDKQAWKEEKGRRRREEQIN